MSNLKPDTTQLMKSRFRFASGLLAVLSEKGICVTVLNGYDFDAKHIGRDVDLYIDEKNLVKVVSLFKEYVSHVGWAYHFSRVMSSWFPGGLIQVVAATKFEGNYINVAFDLIYRPFLFAGVCQFPLNFSFQDNELIFVKNNLIKYLANKPVTHFFHENDVIVKNNKYFNGLLGAVNFQKIITCSVNRNEKIDNFKHIRRKAQFRFIKKHPFLAVRNFLIALTRRSVAPFFVRVPTIVVLGSDGVGKSGIIEGALTRLKGNFFHITKKHWRPGILPPLAFFFGKKNVVNNDSPVQPRRCPGRFGAGRFLYYFIDYMLGYLFFCHRSTSPELPVIIYDRYIYDFYIDSHRYGIKSMSGLSIFLKILPKPDKVILLKDSPEKIALRKNELTQDEIKNQYDQYQIMVDNLVIDEVYDLSTMSFSEAEEKLSLMLLNLVSETNLLRL